MGFNFYTRQIYISLISAFSMKQFHCAFSISRRLNEADNKDEGDDEDVLSEADSDGSDFGPEDGEDEAYTDTGYSTL